MLMSEHDDAYADAMLVVNMQANTRSVTIYRGERAWQDPPQGRSADRGSPPLKHAFNFGQGI